MSRAEVRSQATPQRVEFSFKGGHTFQDQYRTTSEQTIEANIWQAGVESDVLLLGVSFSTKDQVLLNTVHVAKPDHDSQSRLDPGMVIRTRPLPARASALDQPPTSP